ncbi:MFS transporter [Streptacidiphilus fuscans]|uniref:MFS transporter n=1 Tax=Streptacidiphilus fuscans TaxID=2789292 RepID=A0A931B3Q1_9ACTN|nr:MFS transporter [Streptacidiphilus fuscans]MBF9069733.1 MFS transporter [Streptacidiphilus fuscans]
MTELSQNRRARRSVSAVFVIHGAVTGSFATRIPWIKDHLHLSAGQLGLALVAPAIGSFVAMPLASRLLHARGHRAGIRLLIVLWSAALALPALAPDLPLLALALLCYGAAAGVADVAMNAQGVEVEARLGRSIMSGLHGMWSVGGLLGSAVGVAAAAASVAAPVHLAAVAAVLVLLSLVACRGLLDIRPEPEEEAPPRFTLPPRSALLIGAVGFCAVFAEGASGDWSGVYLRTVASASPAIAAASYTAFACTMAAARLAGDMLVRRFGPKRTVRGGGMIAVAGGVLVVAAPTAPTAGPVAAITGFALLGIGIAVVVPLCFAAAGHSGDNPSRAIAGVATVTYTSSLIAPATIGAIAQATSLRGSFAVVTLLTVGLVVGAGILAQGARASGPGASGPRAGGAGEQDRHTTETCQSKM